MQIFSSKCIFIGCFLFLGYLFVLAPLPSLKNHAFCRIVTYAPINKIIVRNKIESLINDSFIWYKSEHNTRIWLEHFFFVSNFALICFVVVIDLGNYTKYRTKHVQNVIVLTVERVAIYIGSRIYFSFAWENITAGCHGTEYLEKLACAA